MVPHRILPGRVLPIHWQPFLSAAMLLRYSLQLPELAERIEAAVKTVLQQGLRTGDIFVAGCEKVGTAQMGDAVVAAMRE